MLKPSFLDPQEVLNEVELRKDMIAVDFGCGSGGWVIPLAKRLKKGKVYALDVQEEALSSLESRARMEQVFNIEAILCDLENPETLKLASDSTDLVLMTNLLFQLENKEKVFNQANKILRKGGQILIIDWKEASPLGPKEGRITIEKVREIAEKAGFNLREEFEAGDYHYGLVLIKI